MWQHYQLDWIWMIDVRNVTVERLCFQLTSCFLCFSARSAHLLVILVFHSQKQAQSSCWFRSLYLIDVHRALPCHSVLHNWRFALAALNSCEVFTKQRWRRGHKSPFVAAPPICIKRSLHWIMTASVIIITQRFFFSMFEGKTNKSVYRSLDSSVLSSRLQVLRGWIEVVTNTLVCARTFYFFFSFEVVLLLQC